MTLKIAKRGTVAPFIVMDVMRAANEREALGGDVIHLEVGQPSTGAPKGVIEATQKALLNDKVGYTDALGIPALRERIAQYYKDYYQVDVDASRVVVTMGSSCGFLLSFLSAFEAGDKVGLTAPGYPAYRNILRALGYEPIEIPVGPETHFQPTPEILDNLGVDLDGLIVASPGNPTGSMLSREDLRTLCAYCDGQGIRFISDEIYHGITYEGRADTAIEFSDNVILINSFSKYFSMTGWRLGWMIVPEDMVRPIECLAQNMFISAPTLSQFGGIAAFDCLEEADANVALYAKNREMLLNELPKAGFNKLAPSDGAFYIYGDVAHLTNDAQEFCKKILAETGVATTPGVDFDSARGHRFMRFSYAGSFENMLEAAKRLQAFLK
ncbi:pyridoxal phosphate-dependent aminotransferase [Terasakiella sp. A23]|uniref:pyridoxal phosphate-dependent aminotransferase n=1 Tax=Terasakiella sp. FCG-A23 TaxID=3080561 RepID=UPI00295587FD|nr:pyridoxal phosphate-dependent aminotransferase [Terasakiella sp. A23]MDV7339410.1 pyridoxal phosphate-dependent aminotransferase [Terasakiella sp. A23]